METKEGKNAEKITQYFQVWACNKCGSWISQELINPYQIQFGQDYTYSSERELTFPELTEALQKGNISPSDIKMAGSCENCIDSPAFQEEN